MDFSECACSGKTLARLVQPAVMALLADEPLHGYLILQRLGELAMFAHEPPDTTGVYRLLKNMETSGLVTCAWDLQDRGPARRRYALTRAGRECLNLWAGTLEHYHQVVNELRDRVRQACGRKRANCACATPGPRRGAKKGITDGGCSSQA